MVEPVPVDYFGDDLDTTGSLHAQHDFARSDGEEKLDKQEVDYRQSRILSIKAESGGLEELVREGGEIDHAEGTHARIFTLTADLKPKPDVTASKVLRKSLVRGNEGKHVARQIDVSTGLQMAILTIGLTLTWTDFSFPMTNGHVWVSALVLRRLFGNPLALGYLDKITIHLFVISWIVYRFCFIGESVTLQIFGALMACISGAIVSALQAVNLHFGLIFCLLLFCLPGENEDIITVSWWNLPLAVLFAVAVRIFDGTVPLPRMPRHHYIEFEGFKVHVALPVGAGVLFVVLTALVAVEGPYRNVVCSAILGLGYGWGEYVGSFAERYNPSVSKWPFLVSTMIVFGFSIFSAFFVFKVPFILVAGKYFLEKYQHHDLKWNACVSLAMSITLIPRLVWEWWRRRQMEQVKQEKPESAQIYGDLARTPSLSKKSDDILYHHVMEVKATEHWYYLLRLQPSCFLTVVFFINNCAHTETKVNASIKSIADFLLEIETFSSFKGKIIFVGEPSDSDSDSDFRHRLEETFKEFPKIKVQYIWETNKQLRKSLSKALEKCEEKVKVSYQLRQAMGTIEKTSKANSVMKTKDFLKVISDVEGVVGQKQPFVTKCSELGLLSQIGSGVTTSWVALQPWLIWEVVVSLTTSFAPVRRSNRHMCWCLPEGQLKDHISKFPRDDLDCLKKVLEHWMILSQHLCGSCQIQGYLCVPLLPRNPKAATESDFDLFFFCATADKYENMTDEYYNILQGLFKCLKDYEPDDVFSNSVSFQENAGAAASPPLVSMFTLTLESEKDCIKASIWSHEQKIPWDLLDNIFKHTNRNLTPKFFCPVEEHGHKKNAKGPFVLQSMQRGDNQQYRCNGSRCIFPPKSRRPAEDIESLGESRQGSPGEQIRSMQNPIIPQAVEGVKLRHTELATQAEDDLHLDPHPSYDESSTGAPGRAGRDSPLATAATSDRHSHSLLTSSSFNGSLHHDGSMAESRGTGAEETGFRATGPGRAEFEIADASEAGPGTAGPESSSQTLPPESVRDETSTESEVEDEQMLQLDGDISQAPALMQMRSGSRCVEGQSQRGPDSHEVTAAEEEGDTTLFGHAGLDRRSNQANPVSSQDRHSSEQSATGESGSEQPRSLQQCEQAEDESRTRQLIGGPNQQP